MGEAGPDLGGPADVADELDEGGWVKDEVDVAGFGIAAAASA
jgi:hypothetical protein